MVTDDVDNDDDLTVRFPAVMVLVDGQVERSSNPPLGPEDLNDGLFGSLTGFVLGLFLYGG